jgi:hypothetical protein
MGFNSAFKELKLLRDVVEKKLDFYLQRHILRKIQIRFCVVFLMSFVVEMNVKAKVQLPLFRPIQALRFPVG